MDVDNRIPYNFRMLMVRPIFISSNYNILTFISVTLCEIHANFTMWHDIHVGSMLYAPVGYV